MRTLGFRAGEVSCSSSAVLASNVEKGKGGRRWEPGVSTEQRGEESRRCAGSNERRG